MKKKALISKLKSSIFFIFFFSFSALAQISLVKDIRPGVGGGLVNNPETLVFDNHLYFFADDGVHGKELWKSDGTEEGTVMVKDIVSGSGSSFPSQLTRAGNNLFLTANDGVFGKELWKTDGTEEGTVMVKNINPTSDASHQISGLFEYNDQLFFAANDGIHGIELWKSNGTQDGTIMVKDINIGLESSNPRNFQIHNNFLYFTAAGFNENSSLFVGAELFRTAGDEISTELVLDIFTGGSSANPNSSTPSQIISLSQNPYFSAQAPIPNSSSVGRRLCTIEGNNTFQIVSSAPFPELLTKSGSLIYYRSQVSSLGTELYASNGSGTFETDNLVKDIRSGSGSSNPSGLTDLNGTLLFRADDGINGVELWKSNGTEEGTVLVKDIRPGGSGSLSSNSGLGRVIQNKLFFSANDGVHGNELWVTDGTESGTNLVMDLNPGTGNSEPGGFVELNNSVYFTATVAGIGTELFRLDLNSLNIETPIQTKQLVYYFNVQTKELHFRELEEYSKIKLYNLSGMLLKEIETNDSELKIDVVGLKSGVYVFVIHSGKRSLSKKIVIN